jgi:hypothetical protein
MLYTLTTLTRDLITEYTSLPFSEKREDSESSSVITVLFHFTMTEIRNTLKKFQIFFQSTKNSCRVPEIEMEKKNLIYNLR